VFMLESVLDACGTIARSIGFNLVPLLCRNLANLHSCLALQNGWEHVLQDFQYSSVCPFQRHVLLSFNRLLLLERIMA